MVLLATLLWVGAGPACDEARIVTEPTSRPAPEVQPNTLRSRLTTEGIASLLDVTHPEGLRLEQKARDRTFDDHQLSVGPIDQPMTIRTIDATIDGSSLELQMSNQTATIVIPVRVRRQIGTRICRFRLDTGPWTLTVETRDDSTSNWHLTTSSPPSFRADQLHIAPVDECPELFDGTSELPDELRQILSNYLDRSVRKGVRNFVDVSVYEELGLLRGRTRIHRLSGFTNRQGTIDLVGNVPEDDGIALESSGLSADLSIGTSARRAPCARPEDLSGGNGGEPAGDVQQRDFRGTNATFGLAVAEPLLGRLVKAMALGGFMCRGLEQTATSIDVDAPINREDASLDDIGLQSAPVTGPFRPSVGPGAIPNLELRPVSNSVEVTWEGLGVELYGRLRDARVELLRTTATVDFVLLPAGRIPGAVRFEINAIDIRDVRFQSPWRDGTPERAVLERWTQRLYLEVFEESFRLPLPLLPKAPLELHQTRVRPDDLLLLLQFRK